MLPQKLYEALRWILVIVVPAFTLLLTTLTEAWGWNIPLEGIIITIESIALFLGTIFGISKIQHDKDN